MAHASTDDTPGHLDDRQFFIRLVTVVAVVAGCLVAWPVTLRILFPGCDWSSAEYRTLESAPLPQFLDGASAPRKATCNDSLPDSLYWSGEMPAGQTLPDGWWRPDDVAPSWTVAIRQSDPFGGRLLCYVSTAPEFEAVQLRVWERGDKYEVEISKDREPCGYDPPEG
jgi:hypothetical protein